MFTEAAKRGGLGGKWALFFAIYSKIIILNPSKTTN